MQPAKLDVWVLLGFEQLPSPLNQWTRIQKDTMVHTNMRWSISSASVKSTFVSASVSSTLVARPLAIWQYPGCPDGCMPGPDSDVLVGAQVDFVVTCSGSGREGTADLPDLCTRNVLVGAYAALLCWATEGACQGALQQGYSTLPSDSLQDGCRGLTVLGH